MRKQAEERKKKEEEALKEAKKLVAQAETLKELQQKAAEVYKKEIDSLTRVNRDNLSAEDMIKLEEKLKQGMGIKRKIKEESNREVENKVREKKQVVNGKILKSMRIVVAHMNLIDGKGKGELE